MARFYQWFLLGLTSLGIIMIGGVSAASANFSPGFQMPIQPINSTTSNFSSNTFSTQSFFSGGSNSFGSLFNPANGFTNTWSAGSVVITVTYTDKGGLTITISIR